MIFSAVIMARLLCFQVLLLIESGNLLTTIIRLIPEVSRTTFFTKTVAVEGNNKGLLKIC